MLRNDEYWMSLALQQAKRASMKGEVPVGAVLVSADGRCLAQAYNQTCLRHDPSAHAEILVLRRAGERIGNHRLTGVSMYVTLEPCPMCASAMIQARIHRLVFATRDWKTGAAGTTLNLFSHASSNHRVMLDEGVFAEEASALLQEFFQSRR